MFFDIKSDDNFKSKPDKTIHLDNTCGKVFYNLN